MIYNTKFLGQIEIGEPNILEFDEGIPGLENYHKFIILDLDTKSNLKCLQSIEDSNICLVLINPWDYFKDYEIELFDDDISKLKIGSENDVLVYNVLTVRETMITANLLAPIVINVSNNKAKQIVFSNLNYSIRQEIPCLY